MKKTIISNYDIRNVHELLDKTKRIRLKKIYSGKSPLAIPSSQLDAFELYDTK